LAADSKATKLGIDIMKIEYSGGMQRINDFFRIMHRQFSDDEWKYIKVPSTDTSRLARFMRLWSLKESFVKAEGSGIVFPLSKISFTCPTELTSPEENILFDSNITINGQCLHEWKFEESMIDRLHYVSVAKIRSDQVENLKCDAYQFKMLTIDDLLTETPVSNHLFTYDDEKYWTDFCRKT